VEHLETTEFVRTGLASNPGDDVLVFTIHDGDQLPRRILGERTEEVLERPEVKMAHLQERDWGANLVAGHLAREAGLEGHLQVNLARLVLDFGRFPGSSAEGEAYLLRHALYPPFEHFLDEDVKQEILARYYDGISNDVVQHFADKRVTIAVHTYDDENQTGTERPELSLVERSLEYQQSSTVPPYVFDPLFPPILCESTSHRILTYRMLLDLERGGYRTVLNYPYVMPMGSVEIRAQVWFFFRHVRDAFLGEYPGRRDDPAYQRVWQMLLDVNRRSSDAERLRGYLHRYRDAPRGDEQLFVEARRAYGEVSRFLAAHRRRLVDDYRFSPARPSCLGIEVRKDLLYHVDLKKRTAEPRADADRTARQIARTMAPAIRGFLEECPLPASPEPRPRPDDDRRADGRRAKSDRTADDRRSELPSGAPSIP
jgi:hypothetical protein